MKDKQSNEQFTKLTEAINKRPKPATFIRTPWYIKLWRDLTWRPR